MSTSKTLSDLICSLQCQDLRKSPSLRFPHYTVNGKHFKGPCILRNTLQDKNTSAAVTRCWISPAIVCSRSHTLAQALSWRPVGGHSQNMRSSRCPHSSDSGAAGGEEMFTWQQMTLGSHPFIQS